MTVWTWVLTWFVYSVGPSNDIAKATNEAHKYTFFPDSLSLGALGHDYCSFLRGFLNKISHLIKSKLNKRIITDPYTMINPGS